MSVHQTQGARVGRWATTCSLVGLLLGAALVAGCRDNAPPPGTLRLVVGTPPEAIDPRFATSAVGMRLSRLVYAPLLIIGDDLIPAPYLAASISRPTDTRYEIVLREGASFHDGTPVTAHDVVYTFAGLNDEDVKSPHAPKFKRVSDVIAVDERTVHFELDQPFAAFPLDLCAVGIVPASCRGRTAACRERPIGSGPFAVETFDSAAETLLLTRHPGFPHADAAAALGTPGKTGDVEHLDIRVVRDGTTRLLELVDGKADVVVGDISPTQLDVIEREPALEALQRSGLAYSYLAMNLRKPRPQDEGEQRRTRAALSDPRVRRAIAHALDIDRVIRTKLRGSARRATGMLPPGHWAKDEALTVPGYDPDRARALMDEAGFDDRGEAGGGRFKVVLSTTTDRLRRSIAIVWAHQLREVGIDVTVRVGEWATLYEDIKRGSFEMFSAQWVPVVEPDLMHWVFHSENIPGPNSAGGNRGAFIDEEVDAWLEAGRTALDPDVRRPYYQQIERRLVEQMPYVPLWFDNAVAVHRTRVKGFSLPRTQSFLGLASATLDDGGGE
jgi:peptide/nickel transport system substrate-binding protein